MSKHRRRRRYKDRRWSRTHRMFYVDRPLLVSPKLYELAREFAPQWFVPVRRGMPGRETSA